MVWVGIRGGNWLRARVRFRVGIRFRVRVRQGWG